MLTERIHDDSCKLRGGLSFVSHIPRNGYGKILRNQLRQWAEVEWTGQYAGEEDIFRH